ncbi:MAG: GIY-YIG nuclease family protein [Bacteroidales bacterium]|jgi:putative endonuclease|nr:GIY-YIG nuclease family protein [Bacteroidales bacterium]
MKKYYFVYIVMNENRTTLYTGFTGQIKVRIQQHENKEIVGFSSKYNCTDLVFYEKYDDPNTAIFREKQIKKYSRKKKLMLIEKFNPELKTLNQAIYKVDENYL